MRKVLPVVLACLLLAVAAAKSQSAPEKAIGIRASYGKCMDMSGGVTANMLDCMGEEGRYQDQRLNRAYHALMSKVRDKQGLRLSERRWIADRDARCRPAADGGTAAEVTSQDCYVSETAKQAAQLEAETDHPPAN